MSSHAYLKTSDRVLKNDIPTSRNRKCPKLPILRLIKRSAYSEQVF